MKGFNAKMKTSYKHTIAACSLGYVVQAVVNNFVPLLFVFFSDNFGISLSKVTFLVTINFAIQLLTDLVSAGVVSKIGYKASVITADALAAAGLISIGILPYITDPYTGLLISILMYAVGGGLLEVVVSPMVEACPTEHKASTMSILHSFYCWGHVFVVILSTLFFKLFGMENWRYAAFLWAIWPIANIFFFLNVPIPQIKDEGGEKGLKGTLSSGIFWLMFIFMVCAGAAELSMSQWSSAFAEKGLNVSKTTGDLLGTLMFALLMGISRLVGAKIIAKISLKSFMLFCSALCVISYLIAGLVQNPVIALLGCGLCGFSVGVMWPGTYSLSANKIPNGGTAMFALLALGGDIGCSAGPTLVGLISGACGDNLRIGLLSAVIFPVIFLIGVSLPKDKKK